MAPSPTISRASPARLFALVAIGGGVGSLVRHGALSAQIVEPTTTVLLINVVGSALLGALLARLRPTNQHRPANQRRAELAALFGTGFCGGFTTFSTHMVDVANRLDSSPAQALGSLVATAVLAVGAAAAGYTVADRRFQQTPEAAR